METLTFILHNLPAIGERTVEHVSIVSVAVGFAILTGVPLGHRDHAEPARRRHRALPRLDRDDHPVDRALRRADPAPVEDRPGHRLAAGGDRRDALRAAADRPQHLHGDPQRRSGAALGGDRHGHVGCRSASLRVEIPIALPVIIAGVRIAVVINIGVTAIAAYIGAGGLGTFISRGISQTDIRQLITGALALGLLAIACRLLAALAAAAADAEGRANARASVEHQDDPPRIADQDLRDGAGTATAVDRVSFEVGAGETCVLLGPSGCGKTTTLRMINRLVAPTSGKIFIAGRDTGTVDPVELRRTIGYVIQQIGLFPNMTVAENIGVVPRLLGLGSRADAPARRGAAGDAGARARAVPRPLSERAFGRPGAARRRRARARRRSAGAADGRAVRRGRSGQSRSDPGRVPAHAKKRCARRCCSSATISTKR